MTSSTSMISGPTTSNTPASELIIDIYEPNLIKDKLTDLGFIAKLDIGDYVWVDAFNRNWGIERKEYNDLMTSFGNGRLTEQLRNLVSNFDFPILLLEGQISQTETGQIRVRGENGSLRTREYRWETIQTALLEAQLAGIKIQQSTSPNSSAQRIRQLVEWSNRDKHTLLDKARRKFEFGTKLDEREAVLAAIPSVGPDLAKELIRRFKTPFMAMATFRNPDTYLKDVPMLGTGKVRKVRKILFDE